MQVTIRNPLYSNKAFTNQQPFFHYEGEAVPVPTWVDYPAIAMKTGRKGRDFPVRIIDLSNVISIDDKPYTPQDLPKSRREIQVTGSKGDIYTVTVDGKHKTCTCQAFQFRRNCKHIIGVE